MDITAFILFLFGLQAICLMAGSQSSKSIKTQEDYFLAGKGVRFFPLMMTFLATQVGGGLVLGSAEEAYKFGWPVLLYPLGASLGLIFLSLGLGRKLAQFKVSTVAQLFEVVYGSAFLRKIASSLSILSLFMIFVAQVIASNKFMISLGIDSKICFILFWGIVILYTSLGGLKAVVATDVIQAGFFIVVFFLTIGYIYFNSDVSTIPLLDIGSSQNTFEFNASKLFGWLFMPLLFMVIEQDMGQRCFAADSPRTVSKATLAAGFLTIALTAIPVFFGVWAKASGLNIAPGASVFMTMIQKTTTPVLSALVACAILAAIISTADSLINAIGSNLSQDFQLPLFNPDKIRVSQFISVGIALSGIAFSFYFDNIVDVLIQSYELSVSCLFAPIFMALFNRKGNVLSALLSISLGAIGFILFKMVRVSLPKELGSLLFSFAGYAMGELYCRRKMDTASNLEYNG
jgi:SSS family solute:Na+ symporter